MKYIVVFTVLFFVLTLALDRPTNYAASASGRGGQQAQTNFAKWNITANDWQHVIDGAFTGSLRGTVQVGTGVLAFGSITAVGTGQAAGLAYYDGNTWCAPEGVGLYQYTPSTTLSTYQNLATAVGNAFAAVAEGNDVYLLGGYNQVGLFRGGVAGFSKLTWSAGGVFTLGLVGRGFDEQIGATTCNTCPGGVATISALSGTKNKLMTYTSGSDRYFIFQDNVNGNLWRFVQNGNAFEMITTNGVGLSGNIRDFHIQNNIIYAVGNFDNTKSAVATQQYLHIAQSADNGNTWTTVGTGNPLPVANFASLPAVLNASTGATVNVALTAKGLDSIYVVGSNEIYVSGGWRVTSRDTDVDNLAGHMQTRVILISNNNYTLISERWGPYSTTGPNFDGPTIDQLLFRNNVLYAYGGFSTYRQVVPRVGTRFGARLLEVYRGAAMFSNGVWAPAHGGFLTNTGDATVTTSSLSVQFSQNSDALFFSGTFDNTYLYLTGALHAYDGDRQQNRNDRWNPIAQNFRFVRAFGGDNALQGNEGSVNAIHVTDSGNALLIGGQFDYIGATAISAVAWYDPEAFTLEQVGGGLFTQNNMTAYKSDNFNNFRQSGLVIDFEERDNWIYAAGQFNRNSTGYCLGNIARVKFDRFGAGWQSIDGGCNNVIRDLQFRDNLLYATGDFTLCGLAPAISGGRGYNGGLFNGRVPTNRIAVIDVNQNPWSWRPLGLGLNGGSGYALARSGNNIYVGGSFNSVAGLLVSDGLARWDGNYWRVVVAKCRGACDRPIDVTPYIQASLTPTPTSRKPVRCDALAFINGRLYCNDAGLSRLAFWQSETWTQAANLAMGARNSTFQNSQIVRNGSHHERILIPTSSNPIANSLNLATYHRDAAQYVPTHGGFSVVINVQAPASVLHLSHFLVLSLAAIILFFLF